MKTALITGITGQDGTYLAELLSSKGYRVAGTAKALAPGQAPRFAGSRTEKSERDPSTTCRGANAIRQAAVEKAAAAACLSQGREGGLDRKLGS